MRVLCIILFGLLLSGCAETAARFVQEGAYLHETADRYVREVHEFRQWIRQECRASLVREIEALRQAGDEEALRAMLAEHYPGLVTIDVLKEARDDPTGILSRAPGCE